MVLVIRHRRQAVAGVITGLGLLDSVAAVTVGGGPYFDIVQPGDAMAPGQPGK